MIDDSSKAYETVVSQFANHAPEVREMQLNLLAERDMRIGNLAKLGRAEWQIDSLNAELRDLRARIDYLERVEQDIQAVNQNLYDEIHKMREILNSVLNSKSYKLGEAIARPYRALGGRH